MNGAAMMRKLREGGRSVDALPGKVEKQRYRGIVVSDDFDGLSPKQVGGIVSVVLPRLCRASGSTVRARMTMQVVTLHF